uniref:Uncharacterized protein n=1 Tax=Meloidogyne enterolobii TaxID=390850 RepID=A0A6V7UR13_MELEN|nr:unnamed protein product [Meloidogyne enterolobii]
MVFENVVADLLNRFLGSYIDNLNASQLNIGIWGGDVKLNNLDIKETALDDLDLPVRLKFGYIQSLVLKIPWKYLYTEPTIVNISEIYMIIVPNQGIVYNEEKAKKNEQEAKQKKLTRLEENRRNKLKQNIQTDDTFTEKLVAQVIKNLQIRIKRVHLRYEDKFSNRGRPFATGVTLDSLNFQTTDENFQLTVQKEAVKIFYKLVSMNHLSIYSNAGSTLISDLLDKKEITKALCNSISTDTSRPEGYKYVLEPLSLNAKLKLNQKPETDGSDWTIPKVDLILQLEKLALAIGKFQYQDFLLFLEAQERFNLSAQYFKYRPNLIEYKNHYKEWWKFAYNCILHEHVKRRRNNWSWERMNKHRQMVRDYKEAWIVFRTEKNPNEFVKKTIENVEEALDVFNLNIARQQAEFEIDRRDDLIRVEDQKQEGWVGWAKSWFVGSGKKVETEQTEADAKIMEKIEQAVTPEEKQKLFEAIDYQENTPPTDYPKHFVENRINFGLASVVISLENVLEMRFADLTANLDHRPSANAIKYISCIKSFEMNAFQENAKSQSILKMTDSNRPWLKMQIETNPLNKDFDQSVELLVAPIMLMYHAPAVNKALDVFKPPETVRLQQLTALAIARYEEVKARSTTALQHMVEQKRKLKLEIQIDPATIVLCAGGVFDEGKNALVAELGQLNLNTKSQSPERAYEKIRDQKLKSLMAQAYDNFQLSLSNVQLIFADTFKTCMQARNDRYSPYHLLKPTNMVIDVLRSTIDDLQLPMFRMFGNLPDVVLIISDDRLVKLLELLNSIPRPEFDQEVVDLSAPIEGTKLRDRAKMVAIMEVSELDENILLKDNEEGGEEKSSTSSEMKGEKKSDSDSSTLHRELQIQFDINLSLNEVGIVVNKRDKAFLSAHICRLGFHLRKRMFDMIAKAHLGSLTLEMPQIDSSGKAQTICLIDNEMREGDHLIDMVYKQATGESPSFKTEFNSNEQSINFVFQILNFNLYKDVLNDLKNFNDRLQRKLSQIKPPQIEQASPQTAGGSRRRTPSISSRSREGSLDRKTSGKKRSPFIKPDVRLTNKKKFVFDFRMHEIAAKLYARQGDIAGGIDPTEDPDAILEFCALNIRSFKLNGSMVDDGSMHADISLQAFTMDDRRKNATIHRLMDKKDTESTDQFVTIKYSQNNHGDKFVDLLSSKFFLMLAPEFLGVLSTFFILKPDEDVDEKTGPSELFLTPNSSSNKLALSKQYVSTSSVAKQALATKGSPAEQSTFEPPGTLTLNCKVYAIEIILIEDSLNPSNSQAIILSFDALLDAKNLNGVQQMDGGIQHFKIYSTYFAKEKRHLSNYQILKEMDIKFTGSIDDQEHTQNFSVKIDQVTLRVSPSIIRLLSAVSAQFSEHQRKDQEAKSARAILREYQDYWKPRVIENDKYWWFQLGNDSVVEETAEEVAETTQIVINQKADFTIKQFIVTVEAGMKDFTRPMILLESAMLGSAKNWSTQLIAEAEARLQISYYNEAFNVWEPLIEPVLHQYEGWQSWRLTLKISSQLEEDTNSQQQQRQGTSKSIKDKINQKKAVLPPKMALIFEAREMMNITVSKSFLLLVNKLSESFEKAAKQISPPKSRHLPGSSSYMLLNETGLEIKICNTSTLKASQKQTDLECNKGEYIPLELIENNNKNGSEKQLSAGNWQMKEDQRHVELQLKIEEPKTERIVNILRAEMQCIDLPKEADSGRKWALVVDTQLEDSRHLVVLRSPVNVINRMDMSVEFQSHKDLETIFCGVSAIDSRPLNIPLPQLYTPDGELSIRPEGGIYDWSDLFSWHDFDNVKRKTVRCGKKGVEHEAIFIEMVVTEEKIRRGAKSSEYSIYTINLFPPIHFVNLLPLCLEIVEPIRREVTSGEGVDLYNLIAGMPFVLKLENGGEVYKMKMTIPEVGQRNDLTVIKLLSETSNKELCLGLNWSIEFLRTTLSLFTPYWMVNDTGKELIYQQTKHSEIKHLPNQNPIILPLNEEDFYEKKKAKLRISDSEWSAEFPLDSAGSSGRITCHSEKKDFELTVDVKLCQSGLTKVVTISPFYLLQNDSKYCIEVREPNRNEWIIMPQTSVIGFWPEQKEKRKTLIARFPKTKEESIQFPFTENFEGFARVKNSFIGFYIIVSLSDDSSVINIEQFMPGMVPAILMNATKFPIKYWQAEVEEEKTLEPGQVIPFSWDCLITKEARLFEWKSGEHSGSDELLHNRDSSYLPSRNAGYHFCVSFLNGRQRVVLFTSDASISMLAHEPFEFEQPNMHVEFRLHGVGISLVNNHKCIEVLYMAILPGQGQRDGFWMQYRQTDHQTTLWVKLHNFQIDNQLPSSIFPCMLAMVPQPKSVVKDAPKPFLECSFVMNQSEHSNIVQIKLLEALVQEFSVRMDQSLINEILDMFPKESIETDYNKEAFSKDLELTKGNLNKRALQTRISQAKAYYERLHISPLMIHLSFSQGHVKEGDKDAAGIQWEFLNLILAFFHREAAFYSRTQLQAEIQSHYIKQFIKQAYVLILGLDIIGNPFGLIRDLTAGVQDFFYQPIQGAVTGPLEFVEGMTLGVNSLFSHSVGGVLGAASRITGTLGKGVAALTMDEEYQRKRLQARQQPTNFGEGMFRGVRGVGQGVIDGVTGVISKPVEGAKKGGVSGFLKGTGKGLIGVVTRPVSGVVDLATSMADSVKTVVTNAEEIRPIRPLELLQMIKLFAHLFMQKLLDIKYLKKLTKVILPKQIVI